MNIYQLSSHLSFAETQNLLAIAVALGITGLVLVNPALLKRFYALTSRLLGSQARAQRYAAERK